MSESIEPSRADVVRLEYQTPEKRRPTWKIAPRRWLLLAAMWAMAIAALFLPGYYGFMSVVPVMDAYPEGVRYAFDKIQGGRVEPYAECLVVAAFLIGSLIFAMSPLLLHWRIRDCYQWTARVLPVFLLGPWVLRGYAAIDDGVANFVYGYYILCLAHTGAFLILIWPIRLEHRDG